MNAKASEKRKAGVKAKKKEEVNTKVKEKELILGLSSKQIIVFLLVFMVVSAIFLGVWYYIGEFYQGVVFFVAKHILLLMGYTLVQISAVNLSGAYLGNFNLVPLVALAIATPKLALRRRIEMLAVGLPLLFLLHVYRYRGASSSFADIELHYMHRLGFATLVVDSLGIVGLAIVFIIWFTLVFGKETGTKGRGGGSSIKVKIRIDDLSFLLPVEKIGILLICEACFHISFFRRPIPSVLPLCTGIDK